jgi:hypothetical protein
MNDDFKRELVKQHPELDLEEDAPLFEGLLMTYRKTLQKYGVQATAEVAAQDVEKYVNSKGVFLQELSNYGLDLEDAKDRYLALELWKDRGFYIVVDG